MIKYIDKGVLLERMNRTRPYEGADGSFERYRRLQWLADMEQINMCPAADVQEVKHGRWDFDEYGWVCSVCGYPMPRRFGKSNYCPKCGSLMVDKDE